jgi:hypothetical protein
MSRTEPIWCVWTEWGEYESFSRDLRGIFQTPELAEAHAAQLRIDTTYDLVEVVENEILDALPQRVPHIEWSAHINPDGSEDKGLGYDRGARYHTFSNELRPLHSSRVDEWSRQTHDLFIEVIGSDKDLVAAEYGRRLIEVRERLRGEEKRREAVERLGEAIG